MGGTGRKGVYGGPWQRVRRTILERDNYTCQIGLLGCTRNATCVDHITPVAWGGAWYDESNLRAACSACNGALAGLARKHAPRPVGEQTRPMPSLRPSRSW